MLLSNLFKLLICQSCYMDFSKLLNGFVKIDTWISLSSNMDLSKLINGFLWGTVSWEKTAVLLDFVQKRGGEGPFQIFCHLYNQDTLFLTITTVDDAFKFPSSAKLKNNGFVVHIRYLLIWTEKRCRSPGRFGRVAI